MPYFPSDSELSADRYRAAIDERHPDRRHHYRLALPFWWRWRPIPRPSAGDDALIPIASYGPPDEPETSLLASSWRVARELRPADWLAIHAQRRGAAIVERLERPSEAGTFLDALLRQENETGQARMSRCVVHKQVPPPIARVTLVEARTSDAKYGSWADDFAKMVTSFRHLTPSPFPYSQNLHLHAAALPGDYATYLPASWRPERVMARRERGGTELTHFFDDDPRQLSRITLVCSGAARSSKDVLDPFLRSFERPDLRVERSAPTPVEAYGGLTDLQRIGGTLEARTIEPLHLEDGTVIQPRMQLRIDTGRCGSTHYLLGLVCPTGELELTAAAIAERAYELMKQTFEAQPVA